MLDVRLARLALPLPVESAIRCALTQPERVAQHEGLVQAWELTLRVLAGALWAACREVRVGSPALDLLAEKLERPSFGHWVELLRTAAAALRGRDEPVALAFAATLDALQQPIPSAGGLRQLAERIAALPAKSLPRPRRVQELVDLLPTYRNEAQSTHAQVSVQFREESVPLLLEGLLDFCERVPLCGSFALVLVRRLERAPTGYVADLARLHGTSLTWQRRALDEVDWKRLQPARPYLLGEPIGGRVEIVPLFPMAAASPDAGEWRLGWYARQVHAPTVVYQGAPGTEFQMALAPDELSALTRGARGHTDTHADANFLRQEPYRGLLAYEEEHAPIFFGREEDTEAAIARIQVRRTLVIFGASGSGKSSWLRAGLLPALRASEGDVAKPARVLLLVPGDKPIAALRRALKQARAQAPEEAARWALAVDSALPEDVGAIHGQALAHLLHGLATEGTTLVLAIDQLEEALLQATDREEGRVFLGLVAAAAAEAREVGAVILAGVRADLLAPLLENEGFRAWLQRDGWPMASIPAERLVRVILDPLRGREVSVEPGLAETILADVASEPGALALVSQVLATLWQERERHGGGLTKRGYVDAGRVSGALERQAEAALARSADPRCVDRLFRALAQTEDGERFTRRRVELATLASELDLDEDALRAASAPFVERRLVVLGGEPGGSETLEVGHERLLDAWPRLRTLLASERESLELRREVEHASTAWESSGKQRELWSDATSKLRRAEELLVGGRLDLAVRERAFLRASRTAARARKRLEHAALAGLAVLTLTAGTAAFFALRERARAEHNAEAALQRTKDVLSLSAIQDLQDLSDQADAQWPASPEKLPAYERWLEDARILIEGRPSDLARGLEARPGLREHEAKLRELAAKLLEPDERALPSAADREVSARAADSERVSNDRAGWRSASGEDRWWHVQLARLVADLHAFEDESSGLGSSGISARYGWGIARRAAFARTIRERSVDGAEAARAWTEALDSIGKSARYRGAAWPGGALRPELGLLPIGADPASGLWEFAHLQTGDPARRGADGALVLGAGTGVVFVLLPGGSFPMGAQRDDPTSTNFDPAFAGDESPVHTVTLVPFFLSKYEMTQGQWERFTGQNPSTYGPQRYFEHWNRRGTGWTALHPVESVTWTECARTLQRLGLELPTEAQWEYAARGDTETSFWTGLELESLEDAANLSDAYGKSHGNEGWSVWESELDDGNTAHAEVGSYRANPFGLHDVVGNVWEWCRDWRGPYDLPVRPGDGERQVTGAAIRVHRGGSFIERASFARSAARSGNTPDTQGYHIGLRPARGLTP